MVLACSEIIGVHAHCHEIIDMLAADGTTLLHKERLVKIRSIYYCASAFALMHSCTPNGHLGAQCRLS